MKNESKVAKPIARGTPGLDRLLSDARIRRSYDFHRLKGSLAVQVKRARAALGITQAELARRVDTSQPEIARLEKGQTPKGPTLHTIERLVEALDGEFDVRIVGRRATTARVGHRRHGGRYDETEVHRLFTARRSGASRKRLRKARALAKAASCDGSDN